jgi:outer membrane protein OmpA-like peptidoglycan-associated protein
MVVVDEAVTMTNVPCKSHYYSNAGDNWFMQLGAGITIPYVENSLLKGDAKRHITAAYNIGFGKWFTPYVGWRLSFFGGSMHYDTELYHKAKYVSGNYDLMWNMLNSFGGVSNTRVFSIVPFVGLGGTFVWDFNPRDGNVYNKDGKPKRNSWTLPVSAGLQLKFRLCRYADFFIEGRAQFYGDNFNNVAYGRPIDINATALAGFNINFGGSDFKEYNPCDYIRYVNSLNGQVNELRAALAATAAALAEAESQLPCPEVTAVPVDEVVAEDLPPLMATVRFAINSATICDQEMVNIYNTAAWMQNNPDQNVVIFGFADKATGTSSYNMQLSQRRAQAVMDALVNKYGINPDRLAIQAEGSNVQPYDVNNWNRIVIFEIAD